MLTKIFSLFRRTYLIFLLFAVTFNAMASVTVLGTRVIYNEKDKMVSVTLDNKDNTPSILQLWVDNTDKDSANKEPNAPFVVTPYMFKIAPKIQQTARIMFTQADLPKDRETLFWLNVHQIPAARKESTPSDGIQFSILNKMKLFYRPSGIKTKIDDLPNQLQFTLKQNAQKKSVLVVNNPTGFYVNFSKNHLLLGNEKIILGDQSTVAPFSSIELKLPNAKASSASQIKFSIINDHGGIIVRSKSLTH